MLRSACARGAFAPRLGAVRALPARWMSTEADAATAEPPEPVAPPPATAAELRGFVEERREWTGQVNELRKQYAAEQEARRQAELERQRLERIRIERETARRMARKLARSAVNKKRVQKETDVARAEFERRRAFTDELRAKREGKQEARYSTLVELLAKESELWLRPDTYETSINEEFVEKPLGMAGYFPEYSPFWGYEARVETVDEDYEDEEFDKDPDLYNIHSDRTIMRLAMGSLRGKISTVESYVAYKRERENPMLVEETIEKMRAELIKEYEMGTMPRGAMEALGYEVGAPVEYDDFLADSEPQTTEKLKLEEQLARLRDRRRQQQQHEQQQHGDL